MGTNIWATLAVLMLGAAAPARADWLTASEAAYRAFAGAAGAGVQLAPPMDAEPVYLLEVPAHQILALKARVHGQLGHCGGFMHHRSEFEARRVATGIDGTPLPLSTRPSYRIAMQTSVAPMLAQMQEGPLRETIVALSSLANRNYNSEHGLAASNLLATTWSDMSAAHAGVSVSRFAHDGYAQQSVIATIAGRDKASEVVVLGAHLDSINILGLGGQARAPGADDNASGIAGLTEVLRSLVVNQVRPARTIKLIGYAAEEVGLRGSQDMARQFKQDQIDVVGVLQLDMTNYQGSERDITIISDYTDAEQNTFIARLIETYLPTLSVGTDKCGYACSDHASWTAHGYAASMPFESMLRQDNPHIHSRHDTYANSGSQAVHALKFARLATAFAVEMGE